MTLRVYAVCYLIFLYLPILLLLLFAFNDSSIIAFPLDGFTLRWFVELWNTPALHAAARNSIIIAVLTAIFSTLLGICAARAAAKYEFPLKRPIMGLIMVPLVLPEIIVGVSLLVVVVQLFDWSLGTWTVVGAHVLICTPFSIAILNGAFQNMDTSLEEAAQDLGETAFSTFRLVTLPLVMPGIISSLLISFTISLDEFIIAFFLTGSNPTMPVYIWGLLRFPQMLPAVMALGTILVLLSIVLLVVAEYYRHRGIAQAGLKDKGGFL